MAVIPFYGDVSHIYRGDSATVRRVAIPANVVADL